MGSMIRDVLGLFSSLTMQVDSQLDGNNPLQLQYDLFYFERVITFRKLQNFDHSCTEK